MIIHLSIAALFAGLGSYVSFFKPEYLSSNIESKPSGTWQWVASFIALLFCIGTVLYLSPQNVLDWGYAVFMLVFFFIAAVDLHSKIIPNTLLVVLILVTVPKLYLQFEMELMFSTLILFMVFTLLNVLVQRFYSKQVFGWGDVKLITILALYSGWEILWVIYLGVIFAGVLSIFGVLLKKISGSSRVSLAIFFFIAFIIVQSGLLGTLLKLHG